MFRVYVFEKICNRRLGWRKAIMSKLEEINQELDDLKVTAGMVVTMIGEMRTELADLRDKVAQNAATVADLDALDAKVDEITGTLGGIGEPTGGGGGGGDVPPDDVPPVDEIPVDLPPPNPDE